MCTAIGRVTAATVCDHVEPHRGNADRFWHGKRQSLCKQHHDSAKQAFERTGIVKGSDIAGRPTDPGHLWNQTG